VVTELPVTEAYELVIQTILSLIILTILIAALAVWAGVLLAHRASVPIIKLMDTAIRIARSPGTSSENTVFRG
jgi:nitrogen fixation/metabolism regulation signal transduction histidine kinase